MGTKNRASTPPGEAQRRPVRPNGIIRHERESSFDMKHRSPASKALNNSRIIKCILSHLYTELLVLGREGRQAHFRNMTLVSRSWTEPASEWLWVNPYFGTAKRGNILEKCLERSPLRGTLIKKLIFGEGSSTDVTDWVTKHCVPNILRAAVNVEILGFDGLKNVDLEDFKQALHSRRQLQELRACDLMPEQILAPCSRVVRLRLYSLRPDGIATVKPLQRALHEVALNQCDLSSLAIQNIFHSSQGYLRKLYLEYPRNMSENDLVSLLELTGAGLENLTVQGFTEYSDAKDGSRDVCLVDKILQRCPNLTALNFPEAIGSPALLDVLVGSKLNLWSFTCNSSVTPEHWLQAFEQPLFPRPAHCRVYTEDWTPAQIRHVRISAYSIETVWLVSGATLTEMSDSFS